ncbi:hypothetical protein N7466_004133 [Penicillium verhagenii]|uniref:uncharacterized protein n=1 Tax=Penicillium verhagenii TaxID=1562060 RepID=UPI0025451609|nr:uncharacterized protein N7466_004133 [Penicillium verhagenii]KAJ5934586.1 hypothetical protein N7466_004133 [Penicillium verhagenii]
MLKSPGPVPDFQHEGEGSELDEDPEDLFESFLGHLFPDDTAAWHRDPGQHILYSSPHYGDLQIVIPSYPEQSDKSTESVTGQEEDKKEDSTNQVEASRKPFAHILWSAALVVAEGAALPSLICALAKASKVTSTDHPSSPALAGSIAYNMSHNLRNTQRPHRQSCQFNHMNGGGFTRMIAADCVWMPWQHENLVRTMNWFLALGGKVWAVVTGFYTGREVVAGFLDLAVESGLEIEQIFERDLVECHEDGREIRREWDPKREGDSIDNRRRWGLVAVLKRKE